MPQDENKLTQAVSQQMKQDNRHAKIFTEVHIAPLSRGERPSGRIDLLWLSGRNVVAMEAGLESDCKVAEEAGIELGCEVDEEAQSRLGTWKIAGNVVDIAHAVSVRYPTNLPEGISEAKFKIRIFAKNFSSERKTVCGTKALAEVLDSISRNGI